MNNGAASASASGVTPPPPVTTFQQAQTPRPQLKDVLFNGSATNEVRPVQKVGKFRRFTSY